MTEWVKVLIDRKLKSDKPSISNWYGEGIVAFVKFNNNTLIKLHQITMSFLTNLRVLNNDIEYAQSIIVIAHKPKLIGSKRAIRE